MAAFGSPFFFVAKGLLSVELATVPGRTGGECRQGIFDPMRQPMLHANQLSVSGVPDK